MPDSSNSSNRYLCVVLCESMQFAKVAHVFEMEKSSGMSSSLTLGIWCARLKSQHLSAIKLRFREQGKQL